VITASEKVEAERLQRGIEFRKKRIKRLKVLRAGMSTPFWKALKEDIELSIESNQFEINQQVEDPQAGVNAIEQNMCYLKSRGGANSAYRGIITNIEYADAKVQRLNEEIGQYNERLKEIEGKEGKSRQPANHRGRRQLV